MASASKEQILQVARLARDNPEAIRLLPEHSRKMVDRLLAQGETDFLQSEMHQLFPDTGPLRRELYPRHMAFIEAGKYARERVLIAGNRTGKSKVGAFEVATHLTGLYPAWWKGRRFDCPVEVWCVAKTWEKAKEVLNQELFGRVRAGRSGRNEIMGDGLLPKDLIVTSTAAFNTQLGQLVSQVGIRHVTSRGKNPKLSWVGLKSAEQSRSAFEGTRKDVIWLDEEPDYEVYFECLMRIFGTRGQHDRGGIMFTTFTPLDGITEIIKAFLPETRGVDVAETQEWTRQEGFPKPLSESERQSQLDEDPRPDLPGVTWVTPQKAHISIAWKHGIPHLSEKAMKEFLAEVPFHQRQARMEGKPMLTKGLIYPIVWDHVSYRPMIIPNSWPQVIAVDPGYKVTAAVAMAIDPDSDTVYVWGCYYQATANAQTNALNLKKFYPWQPGVVDPAAGTRSVAEGERVIDYYREYGLDLLPADNGVDSGLMAVWDRLVQGRLKFAYHLREIEFELSVYRKDDKGKVVKSHDHLMDAIRYGIVSGLDIAKTKEQMERMNTRPMQREGDRFYGAADAIGGY